MSLSGRTIQIDGNVECVEDVLIEGRIKGHVWNNEHVVTVAADAVVTGDIVARDRGVSRGDVGAGRVERRANRSEIVRRFPHRFAERLERFLDRGGGVFIHTGMRVTRMARVSG